MIYDFNNIVINPDDDGGITAVIGDGISVSVEKDMYKVYNAYNWYIDDNHLAITINSNNEFLNKESALRDAYNLAKKLYS
jgi:hypothetical protein